MIEVSIRENNPLMHEALEYAVTKEADLLLVQDKEKGITYSKHDTDNVTRHQSKTKTRPAARKRVLIFGMDDSNPLPEINALKHVGKSPHPWQLLVLTDSCDEKIAQLAMEAGATGLARRSIPRKELIALIRATAAGYRSLPKMEHGHSVLSQLNQTEEAIVRLSCLGLQRREVAHKLALSEGTIKRHIGHILAITEYDSLSHLALDLVAQGEVHPQLGLVA